MPMNTTLETRPGPPGTSSTGERASTGHDLLDDLRGRHVALQPALAGRAEGTGHAAAGLAGDAHRGAVGIAHQHRLDQRPVEEPPQRLARRAAVGLLRAQAGHQVREQSRDELVSLRGRQVGHRGRVVDEAREVVRRELPGTEARQAELLEPGLALGRGQVSEVPWRLAAAGWLVEDEGKGPDWFTHNRPMVPPSRASYELTVVGADAHDALGRVMRVGDQGHPGVRRPGDRPARPGRVPDPRRWGGGP